MYLENHELFSFVGLSILYRDNDGILKIGFAIVTMPVNEHISEVHIGNPD